MRLLFTTFVTLLLATSAHAQVPTGPPGGGRPGGGAPGGAMMQGGTVRGRIVDGATAEALEFATVALYRLPDSTLTTGNLADEQGRFEFDRLRPGRYYLSVSLVGYAARRIDVALTPAALTRDLGDVRLEEDARALSEVTVEGERESVTVEVDRTSYNVADQATSAGGTASDVLEKVPAVEVDADGNISLRGSQNVAILINGRPAPVPRQFLANYLRQLPAEQIERVEVIPNPSARYDPDGLAGMLNIVLKTNVGRQTGVSGGVQVGGGTLGEANTSANVNVTGQKLNAYASYGLRRDARGFRSTTLRETLDLTNGTPTFLLDQEGDGTFGGLSHVFNTTLDYTLTKRQSLSLQGLVSFRNGSRDNSTAYRLGLPGAPLLGGYDRLTDANSNGFNTDATLSYRNVVTPSRNELTAEIRFGLNRDDDESTVEQAFRDSLGGLTGARFTETSLDANDRTDATAQVDYVRPLFGDKGKVEAGFKGTFRTIDTEQDANRLVSGALRPFADAFTYRENVQAAYLTLARQLGKFGVQGGLRAENVLTDFESASVPAVDNDYFSLFPSAFLTFAPTAQNSFRLSYSRRIDRANPRDLNPVVRIDDPVTRQVGNPALRPAYTDAFGFAYNRFWNGGYVQVEPFYRRSTDVVQRVSRADAVDPNVTNITFANIATSDESGVEVNGSVRLATFTVNGAVSGRYFSTEGVVGGETIGVSAYTWNTRVNAEWTPRAGSTLSGFVFYNPPRKTEQGRFGGFSRADVSFRQRLLADRATLTLRLSDPFAMQRFKFESAGPGYTIDGLRRPESRQLSATLAYTFGQQPQARRQQRRPQEQQQQDGDAFGQ